MREGSQSGVELALMARVRGESIIAGEGLAFQVEDGYQDELCAGIFVLTFVFVNFVTRLAQF